jgi:hypothetical protein
VININKTLNKITSLDWLFKIRVDSLAILLILTPPFYFLWLLKIGTFTAKGQGKSYGFFKLSILLLIICSLTFLFLFQRFDTLTIQILIGLTMISWIYACVFSAIMLVKYEYQHRDKSPELIDYIHKFGQTLYWIFGIWVLQPRLNEYIDNERNTKPAANMV